MSGPGGTAMSPALMAEIVREVPTARFIKEETNYEAITASEVMALAGDALHGIMGGKAGKTFMGEHARGVGGTMPACEIADVHVALWHALEAGERTRAWEIFGRLLPLLDMESIYGPALYKEVLRRRGVIASAARRQTGARDLDAAAHDELGEILRGLEPYMLDAYKPRA
jgi:4-hydroxy-tetrahydrodipicolinate synthase